MLNVPGSMSTKTGTAPQYRMTVGGRDEGMADGDHLVARPRADGPQREVKRRGAVRDGAGVRRPDLRGELALEGRHLRPLRDPAGEYGSPRGVRFALVHPRPRDLDYGRALSLRFHLLTHGHLHVEAHPSARSTSSRASSIPRRASPPPGTPAPARPYGYPRVGV